MHALNVRHLLAIACCCLIALPLAAETPDPQTADDLSQNASVQVSFQKEIEPIFSRHCYGCHQGAKQLGSYRMTDFESLLAGGETGEAAIVPGKPDESYLVQQITPVDGYAEMPQDPMPPLHQAEIDLIRRWIEQGASNDGGSSGPRYDAENPPVYAGPPAIPSVDVAPDGRTLAVAGFHEVLLFNSTSGERTGRLVGMSPRINTVRFSPDGKRLTAVGGTPGVRGELQVWDVEAGELILSSSISYDALSGASWSPDGSKIAFGASDNVVRAVDATTGEQVMYQGAHEDWVRDTAFTPDGTHVISVGRDMSCKLTEVATERFIDNITSITPGALSGGLSSVVAHPERNEIFVGGADGIAKVYRVFRETARKIGDDANLVRKMPKMPGRIFSVAISRDASRLAAVSTLDGKSEVRVWKYDFTSELNDELKKILAKRVANRNAEEKKKVDQYRNSAITEIYRFPIDEAAVYAIEFAEDNQLVVAAADGKIRQLDADGKLAATFPVVEISKEASLATQPFDARKWNEMQTQRLEASASEKRPEPAKVRELIVQPSQIDFDSPYSYAQLVVTAVMDDESTADLTRLADIQIPAWTTMTPGGLVRPATSGSGIITVAYGEHVANIKVDASAISQDAKAGEVDYLRDVNPVMSRLGCNAGTCHGAQKGKNGFRLSLRGYDPVFDLRALTDDLAARRISSAAPEESLMLRKPLGLTPHQGGVLMTAGDPNHTILRRWIADGSEVDLSSPRVARLDIYPNNPVVQEIDSRQQVRIVAHYTDGSRRDVTPEAFIESGNTEVASANETGLLTAVRRGEAAILARFEGAYAATTLTVMGDREGYEPPDVETWNRIDELVAQKWDRVKVVPSDLCDDATFLRRVSLDLTGLPPTSDKVREFLADNTPTRVKRARLVDELIGSQAYIDYWTNKWADLLQVNRKYLGVEGSKKFQDWIRESVANNKPYDQFAREILTASGSNNDNPPASYFKVLRNPEDTMENTTHLFLGIRFNCNKCHDHPFERWTQDQYYELSAYFARVELQTDPASGKRRIGGTAVESAKPLYEKVVDSDSGDVMHPRTGKPVEPSFPYDVPHDAEADATRREQLADWITDADNQYFARSYVNRMWGYLLGVGLIEPIDDIRAGNPPTNPELLDHLTQSFIESGFDVAQLQRAICNSRAYQLSVETNPLNEDDKINYSHALPRRLPAEVIYDSVHAVTGAVSTIPGVPPGTRAAALTDAGVKLPDGFLQNLGRPARESACECERNSDLQLGPVMALISGPTIGSAISDPKNELERIAQELPTDKLLAEEIFLRALGRKPSPAELDAFGEMKSMIKENHIQLVEDLEKAEAEWVVRRKKLEAKREAKLAETVEQIASRTEEIKPERERLEKERQERISEAEQKLAEERKRIAEKANQWAKKTTSDVEWFPLAADQLNTTSKAVLLPQSDRSILATGPRDKGVYTITVKTSLNKITGLRLEALSDPQLPSSGPGLGDNGNFVITEFEVFAAPVSDPGKPQRVAIASGTADFLQGGFAIEQTFNGQTRNQQGWAVAGATGVQHWATYKLEQPIKHDGGTVLTFKIHQFHNAADHRLGRVRLSATTADGEIPLGQSEELAAIASIPQDQRTEENAKTLHDYVAATDEGIRKAQEAVAAARRPVPPDEKLVAMEARKAMLSKPTEDDPALVRLRSDVAESTKQVQNIRLTAAEDLTWALINSPAFLFNH